MRKNRNFKKRQLELRMRGATGPSGSQWIRVKKGEQCVWLSRIEVVSNQKGFRGRLACRGLFLSAAEVREIDAFATDNCSFPRRNIVEQPGWNGTSFALPKGIILSATKSRPVRAFELDDPRCAQLGSLDGWLNVVRGLEGQHLATFLLMVTFVAPLLELADRTMNFGLELFGRPGNGKTTLLRLMASVVGNPTLTRGEPYFRSCNTTVNALEQTALAHNDMPLLLDDATQFAASQFGSARGRETKNLIMSLSQGETKARLGWEAPKRFRTVYTMTTNLSNADVVKELEEVEANATGDRLMSMNLDLRRLENLDFVPRDYPDSDAFIRHMIDGISEQYGTAMPHFLQHLVEHRERDERNLRQGIRSRIDEFQTRVGTNRSDGSDGRVAEALGLTFAAGQLAQHYGALPEGFDCGRAAVEAYQLHQATVERMSPFARLKAYASGPGVIDLDVESSVRLTKDDLTRAAGFWRTNRAGELEFLVYAPVFRSAFLDWRRIINDPNVKGRMPGNEEHRGRKRRLRKGGGNDRFYCFLLPPRCT